MSNTPPSRQHDPHARSVQPSSCTTSPRVPDPVVQHRCRRNKPGTTVIALHQEPRAHVSDETTQRRWTKSNATSVKEGHDCDWTSQREQHECLGPKRLVTDACVRVISAARWNVKKRENKNACVILSKELGYILYPYPNLCRFYCCRALRSTTTWQPPRNPRFTSSKTAVEPTIYIDTPRFQRRKDSVQPDP